MPCRLLFVIVICLLLALNSCVCTLEPLDNKEENSKASPPPPPPLQLPSADSGVPAIDDLGRRQLTLDSKLKLDELGPIIVQEDGTLRRITNWDGLSDAEKEASLRIIASRNQRRLEALRRQQQSGPSEAPDASTAQPSQAEARTEL